MTALHAPVMSGFQLQTVHRDRVPRCNRLLCGQPTPSDTPWHPARTGWPMKRARICCNTQTIPSTGIRGAPTPSPRRAKKNKPILLSIGYSACHWCHVMAHESFEDEATAKTMNELFVNIKVDREERPDLDKVYQTAHQLLTQQGGGWPLTMFLDPNTLDPVFRRHLFSEDAALSVAGIRRSAAARHRRCFAISATNSTAQAHKARQRVRQSESGSRGRGS